MADVLIIDDERSIRITLETWLTLRGHRVWTCPSLEEAAEIRADRNFHVVFLDLFLQGENGLDWFSRKSFRDPPVIVISGHGDLNLAVEAVRRGAFDFLEKPLDQDKLRMSLERALELSRISSVATALQEDWLGSRFVEGGSPAMAEVFRLVRKAAPSPLSVLVEGPSGSGKEGLAQALHHLSLCADGPFVPVNCAAIPGSLFESEVFGHRKGAFTGAQSDRKGFFQRAHGGTLFLDEVGEIPLEFQAKLLRALELGEVAPVGSETLEKVRVRVVAATNRNLPDLCRAGKFREDLYFRLAQLHLKVPGLSDRKDDIRPLTEFFRKDFCSRMGTDRRFSPEALDYLENREYRGNIRELRSLVERALVLSTSGEITRSDLEKGSTWGRPSEAGADDFTRTRPLADAKFELEKKYLETQLKLFSGRKSDLAAALGIHPNNLYRKLKDLGIEG